MPFSASRRRFLQAAALPLVFGGSRLRAGAPASRKMTMDLVCGAIGVRADEREAIELAYRYGFESVAPQPSYLVTLSQEELAHLRGELEAKGLVFGAAGLPVDFRREEERFQEGLAQLPTVSRALQQAGVNRIGTWISPASPDLSYLENFAST